MRAFERKRGVTIVIELVGGAERVRTVTALAGTTARSPGKLAGMRICMHLCRGNSGHGIARGGYEPIADFLFGRRVWLSFSSQRVLVTPLEHGPWIAVTQSSD